MESEDERNLSEVGKRFVDAASGIIMLTATAVFLFFGLVYNAWHPAWVSFVIGALLCGIVSTIAQSYYKKK